VVQGIAVDRHENQAQTAVQVAAAAMERVGQLPGDAALGLPATEPAPDTPGYLQGLRGERVLAAAGRRHLRHHGRG